MFIVISSSPNTDGLTAACANAAMQGIRDAGDEAVLFDLCKMPIERCRQCGNGWGLCRQEHVCVIKDDLAQIQEALAGARGVVIVTPVYYGELSESAKCAFDRLRRCESTKGEGSALNGTPVISVAAAGGSGGGITTCLLSMERLTQHLRGQVADLIGVTQRNRAYTVDAIREAAKAMVVRVKETSAA